MNSPVSGSYDLDDNNLTISSPRGVSISRGEWKYITYRPLTLSIDEQVIRRLSYLAHVVTRKMILRIIMKPVVNEDEVLFSVVVRETIVWLIGSWFTSYESPLETVNLMHTGVSVPKMRPTVFRFPLISECRSRADRALGYVRYAVVILVIVLMDPVPVNRYGIARNSIRNVDHDVIVLADHYRLPRILSVRRRYSGFDVTVGNYALAVRCQSCCRIRPA